MLTKELNLSMAARASSQDSIVTKAKPLLFPFFCFITWWSWRKRKENKTSLKKSKAENNTQWRNKNKKYEEEPLHLWRFHTGKRDSWYLWQWNPREDWIHRFFQSSHLGFLVGYLPRDFVGLRLWRKAGKGESWQREQVVEERRENGEGKYGGSRKEIEEVCERRREVLESLRREMMLQMQPWIK